MRWLLTGWFVAVVIAVMLYPSKNKMLDLALMLPPAVFLISHQLDEIRDAIKERNQ